jgi:2,5-diamino-6-(ribosylamino)-4(3H)-pyrimidinone 5'-phosphate reductase
MNMATSLDGKIAPADRAKVRLGTDADIARMEALRTWADVIVIGAGTVRAEDPPMELKDPDGVGSRRDEGRPEHPAVAIVSSTLAIEPGRTFRTDARRIVITSKSSPEPAPELASAAEVWRIGRTEVDIVGLVNRLYSEGMERILVEGGGGLAAQFVRHRLVEEIFLTLTPWLIGSDRAPTIAMAAQEFNPPAGYNLVTVESSPDEIFLTYRKREEWC